MVLYGVFFFALLRVISFLTWGHPELNNIIALLLVMAFAGVSIRKPPFAWSILVGECILDGSGHFFEFEGLLLRTWFLGIFGTVWLIRKVREKNFHFDLPRPILLSMAVFGFFICVSILIGFLNRHSPMNVLQDSMLYLFFLLVFPALEFQKSNHIFTQIFAKTFILGSALFSFITLVIYSSGLGTLPDTYYHWFRNVAAGKITDLGSHFFRIVLPEHLLIVPAILIIASYLLKQPKNIKLWLFMQGALFVVALNFSRIYFLALAVGFSCLAYKQPLKRWFGISMFTAASLLILFTSTHFIASRGTSFGLELLGIRAAGITTPSDDVSGAIRIALLPDIMRTIKKSPWVGSGLGTQVTFTHPVTKEVESRTQFDWGYLELIAELGILGTIAFTTFLILVMYRLAGSTYRAVDASNFQLHHGLIAGAISLFVINITTPALFQGFGVLYFVFILSLLQNHASAGSMSEQSHNA